MTNIKISAFTGMNNVKESGDLFVKKGVAEPRIILNADVTARGRLKKREGLTKILDITGGHSLWGNGRYLLYVQGGYLYYLDNESSSTQISAVTDPDGSKMSYAEVGDLVYMSSQWWNGVFDPDSLSVSTWGISLPGGTVLSTTNGNLDAGTYRVCLTAESGGAISGNGPVAEITLSSESGISIATRSANDVVWCTETNGHIFYKVGKTDTITAIRNVEPLRSLFCFPPPFVKYLTHAFGRMWGAKDNRVYYSEPGHPEWWKLGTAFFEFASPPTLIAKVKTGLFIGCQNRTHFYAGTVPDEMQVSDVGAGAVPGSLTYANNIIELGDTISPPEKKHESVPVWISEEGVVAGNPVGRLFSLSQGKVKFSPGDEGASLYRMKDGDIQILHSLRNANVTDGMGIGDEATMEVIKNKRVISS